MKGTNLDSFQRQTLFYHKQNWVRQLMRIHFYRLNRRIRDEELLQQLS